MSRRNTKIDKILLDGRFEDLEKTLDALFKYLNVEVYKGINYKIVEGTKQPWNKE